MTNSNQRGYLSDEAVALGESLLGKPFGKTELRLLPYLDSAVKNNGILADDKLNDEERDVLDRWDEKGYLTYCLDRVEVSRDFYDAMQEILFQSYVLQNETAIHGEE